RKVVKIVEENKNIQQQMEDLFQYIYKNVEQSKISNKNKKKIKEEIHGLQSFVVGARPARIAIVGRRGAGKSSLINAIFGEPKAAGLDYASRTGTGSWYLFEKTPTAADILDTG